MHLPRLYVIGKVGLQAFVDDALLELDVEHRESDLDAAEEIALHPVGAGQIDVAGALEMIDTMVLEKASDDGAHADVLRHAGYARSQRAHTPNDQIDLHAGVRSFVQSRDRLRLEQG